MEKRGRRLGWSRLPDSGSGDPGSNPGGPTCTLCSLARGCDAWKGGGGRSHVHVNLMMSCWWRSFQVGSSRSKLLVQDELNLLPLNPICRASENLGEEGRAAPESNLSDLKPKQRVRLQ